MVKKEGDFWVCEECFLKYEKKELAEKCEAWCKKYKSCNLQITRFAVNRKV